MKVVGGGVVEVEVEVEGGAVVPGHDAGTPDSTTPVYGCVGSVKQSVVYNLSATTLISS